MHNNKKRNYNNNNRGNNRGNRKNFSRPNQILPPVSVLEQYEELVPGSMEKIVDMVDVEQDHRHRWENRALTAYIFSYRLGQVLGFFYILAILAGAFYAHKHLGDPQCAYFILAGGLGFQIITAILTAKRKKFFERPFKKKVRHR